jgi:ubiquinone/menaquinone biosynthesis C-methylase UbiE
MRLITDLQAAVILFLDRLVGPHISSVVYTAFKYEIEFNKLGPAFVSFFRKWVLQGSNNGTKARILEIGCGYVGVCDYVASQVKNAIVIGMDIDEKFLNEGKKERKTQSTASSLMVSNAMQCSLKDCSFDIVYNINSFEHFTYPEKVINEIVRLLKPGGLVLFEFAAYKTPWGHHLFDLIRVPWIHVLFSDKALVAAWLRKKQNNPDLFAFDYIITKKEEGYHLDGVNKISYNKFRSQINASGLIIEKEWNYSSFRNPVLNFLSGFKCFEDYLTSYRCVCQKPH